MFLLGDYLLINFHLLAPSSHVTNDRCLHLFETGAFTETPLMVFQHQSDAFIASPISIIDKPCHAIGTAGQCHLPLHVSDKNLIDARNILHREICSVNLRQ